MGGGRRHGVVPGRGMVHWPGDFFGAVPGMVRGAVRQVVRRGSDGQAGARTGCRLLSRVSRPGRRLGIALAALVHGRGRTRTRSCARVSDGENGLRPGAGLRPLLSDDQRGDLRAAADLRLPRASGASSCRWWPRRCPRSRTKARPTRSGSARASTSRPIRRSRARSANSPAQDFVYSFKRFMDPKNRSPYAFLIEGKIVGLDELAAAAKKTGKFDYDAKIAGHRGGRPLHAALSPQGHRLQLPVHRRPHVARRRGARSDRSLRRRHDGASGRHRAVRC